MFSLPLKLFYIEFITYFVVLYFLKKRLSRSEKKMLRIIDFHTITYQVNWVLIKREYSLRKFHFLSLLYFIFFCCLCAMYALALLRHLMRAQIVRNSVPVLKKGILSFKQPIYVNIYSLCRNSNTDKKRKHEKRTQKRDGKNEME